MTVPAAEAYRIGIAGWKNAGKTTLAAALVRELSGRGLAVATVKHAHHGFAVDRPGSDSDSHSRAGSVETAIFSDSGRWAIMHNLETPVDDPLRALLARMSPADIVLVEGMKHARHPKIEVIGEQGADRPFLFPDDPDIVAIAADREIPTSLPVFARSDIAALADLIMALRAAAGPLQDGSRPA